MTTVITTMPKSDSLLTGFHQRRKLKTLILCQKLKLKTSCMNAPLFSNSGLQGIARVKPNTGAISGLKLLAADINLFLIYQINYS